MQLKYVSVNTTPLYVEEDVDDYEFKAIRGDEVITTGFDPALERTEVTWRGRNGWVKTDTLSDNAMLEVYFLDVGQGDSTFIVTPGRKTILIDGGKGLHAFQFLMWKYRLDLPDTGDAHIDLLVLTHADQDHIKGLTTVLQHDRIHVQNIVHSGLTSYSNAAGKDTGLGNSDSDGTHTYLIDRHDSVADLNAINDDHLTGNFEKWKQAVQGVASYRAVDSTSAPIDLGDPTVTLRVVGPRLEQPAGFASPVYRSFGAKKYTINGHSVVLQLEHNQVRFLFTGDVNHKSGAYLAASPDVAPHLDAHVLKAPHHGSHEYDRDFLKAVHPQMTVVSSGEEPDYGHPRADFLGIIGKVGRGDPFLFSTELAATFKQTQTESDDAQVAALDLGDPGGLGTARRLWMKRLSGIINVRSDGEHLFAARRVTQNWQWDTYLVAAAARDPV